MRIWLDPAKLNNYSLTPDDVGAALQAQNVQVASGEIGGLPAVEGQRLNATIIGPQRLQTVEQFERILLKVNTNGSQVLLRDVARIGLGAETYSVTTKYNGQPAAGIAIKLAPGSNALDTARAVNETIDKLKPFFPPGLEAVLPFDTTPFVRISIEEVVKTLFEAIVLVFIVMYRIPAELPRDSDTYYRGSSGAAGNLWNSLGRGFSINTLTMFGMVLAIGLLVDDAIVVVENVERVMEEEKLSPRDAARKSMDPDHRRSGGHRAGAVRRVSADGLLQRLDRRDLPAILHHHRFGDDAVGRGGPDTDARTVRHAAAAA